MKIYEFIYTVDEYIDGRMEDDHKLFSSMQNAQRYIKVMYPEILPKLTEENNYEYNKSGKWTNIFACIREIKLDSVFDDEWFLFEEKERSKEND